jgi:hypothetical protein
MSTEILTQTALPGAVFYLFMICWPLYYQIQLIIFAHNFLRTYPRRTVSE